MVIQEIKKEAEKFMTQKVMELCAREYNRTYHLGLARCLIWLKTLGANLDYPGSIPGTHMVERKNQSVKLSSDLHVQDLVCVLCLIPCNK